MSAIDIISLAAAFGVTGWFIWMVLRPDRDVPQYTEDAARAFFDAHGHWPDETPDDAQARARRGEEAERIARQSYRGG